MSPNQKKTAFSDWIWISKFRVWISDFSGLHPGFDFGFFGFKLESKPEIPKNLKSKPKSKPENPKNPKSKLKNPNPKIRNPNPKIRNFEIPT